jgi:hypothetical protein
MLMPLTRSPTEQQARFIAEYLANGGKASQAYKIAYPKAENWTDNAVRVAACRLLKASAVKAAIDKTRVMVAASEPEPLDELRAMSVAMVRAGAVKPVEGTPLSGDVLPPEQTLSVQERTRQAFAHSLAGCIADQEKAMAMAEAAGNAAAYSRAAEVKAKLLGHMVDRTENRNLHAVVDPDEARPDISSMWERTVGRGPVLDALPTPEPDQDGA